MNLYACVIEVEYGEGLAVVAASSVEEVREEFKRRQELDFEHDPEANTFTDAEGKEGYISGTFLNSNSVSIMLVGSAKPDQKPGLVAFGGSTE